MAIDVITACLPRDLPILKLALDGLRRHGNVSTITVATAAGHFPAFRRALGASVELLEEDAVVPGMTIAQLRELPGFEEPKVAGWHFQQLVKFAYGLHGDPATDFLIWDADTVLLRPLDWFDGAGRTWFTMADEYYAPYFDSYRRLLGEEPQREFSFIAQHMVMNRGVLREMLATIEAHVPGDETWPWKIMRGLRPGSLSEYEYYGHFFKNCHPERAAFRRLSWTRDGALKSSRPAPRHLRALAEKYVYAAFEAKQAPWTRLQGYVRRLRSGEGGPLLPSFLRKDRVRP
jgi:hypothetical protein